MKKGVETLFDTLFDLLPSELLDIILSNLAEMGPQYLLGLDKLNEDWKKVLKGVWQDIIQRKLPHLLMLNKAQFHADPIKLIIDEVAFYQRAMAEVVDLSAFKPFILSAILGDLEALTAPSLNARLRRMLYVVAAANNHVAALDKFEPDDIKTTFLLALRRENHLCAQMLLTYDHHHFRLLSQLRTRAICPAAKKGSLEMTRVLVLYPQFDLHVSLLGGVLEKAAKKGHTEIVKLLIAHLNREVILERISYLMFLCEEYDQKHILLVLLPFLLQRFEPSHIVKKLASKDLSEALVVASTLGSLTMVQAILEKAKKTTEIHYMYKLRALHFARQQHRYLVGDIFQALDIDLDAMLNPSSTFIISSSRPKKDEDEVLALEGTFLRMAI